MSSEFVQAIEALGKEKGINSDVLFQAVEEAVVSAYKKNYDSSQNVRVEMSKATGEFHVFEQRKVVEQVMKPHDEISLEEALKMNPNYILGDIVEQEVFPKNFSRVAVQNAKQIIMQRIREAERNMVYDKFSEREDDIVNGMIQRVERGTVYVDLGSTEGLLMANEQVPGERYMPHDRMKFYIIEVKKTGKGPQIMLSRTHPGLLTRLFELEVPEIHDGIVELKSIAREAGMRSKIAVFSNDEKVDPVGSCVGHKGMRVQNIVNELRGEKIDIVKYNTDPAQYVANALSPAQVISAEANDTEKICWVVVIAANEQQPVVSLREFLDAFLIQVLVIARPLESKAAVTCHDNQRFRHAVLHATLKDQLRKVSVNVTAHYDALRLGEFVDIITFLHTQFVYKGTKYN